MGITVCVFTTSCRIEYADPPKITSSSVFFKQFLNWEDTHKYVTDFKSSPEPTLRELETYWFAQYSTQSDFFEAIMRYHDYLNPKATENEAIHEVPCDVQNMPISYTRWTSKTISLKDSKCYKGNFYPYQHIIIRKLGTDEVFHFVNTFHPD